MISSLTWKVLLELVILVLMEEAISLLGKCIRKYWELRLLTQYRGDPGGDLFTSPGDPAFFLHHGQVDRLWTLWYVSSSVHPMIDYH